MEIMISGNIKLKEFPELWLNRDIKIMWDNIRVPSPQGVRYLEHVVRWIKKAKSEKTGFDKFFALWISFNSFYTLYYKIVKPNSRENDKEQIKKIIEDLVTEEDANSIITMLSPKIRRLLDSPYEIRLNWDERDIKNELEREFRRNKFNKHTLKLLVLALYGIRNNLFHGKKPLTSEQERILDVDFEILLPIVSLLLIKYLICYHSGDAPDELCPCKTRR